MGGKKGNKNPSEKVTFKMITRNGGEFQRERERVSWGKHLRSGQG